MKANYRRGIAAAVLGTVIAWPIMGVDGFKCSGNGSSQPAPDPSEKYEYQCSDGSYHVGRKALDKYRETHPDVICKRVK